MDSYLLHEDPDLQSVLAETRCQLDCVLDDGECSLAETVLGEDELDDRMPLSYLTNIEALTAAGEALGLPADTAALLAMQTVAGAGRYAQLSEASPTTLREQVTSPNGTTEAALRVFMTDNRLTDLVKAATTAARDRGIELGKGA